MEESGILESLDSLWFFSNVFSGRTLPMGDLGKEGSTTREDPTDQTQQNESRYPELGTPRCTRCGEVSEEIEAVSVQVQKIMISSEEAEAPKKEEMRSRRRRRKSKRKILGEVELGMDETYLWEWENKEASSGYRIGSEKHRVKMPALGDGMAMKEHLKSWAYAVACTVR